MTQTLDLNKMGLAPMSELEMQEIDRGGLILNAKDEGDFIAEFWEAWFYKGKDY